MKAISLWQPWASLIACGVKQFETRSWAPPRSLIGTTIAIHAAKKVDRGAAEFAQDLIYGQHEPGGFELAERLERSYDRTPDRLFGAFGHATMPVGCVVCTVTLDAAFQLGEKAVGTTVPAAYTMRRITSRAMPACFTVRYDPWGDYAPGRWAWLLSNVRPINPPAPVKGAQGFFDLPQGWLTGAAA